MPHRLLFYRTPAGNEVVLDFIRSLPKDDRAVVGEDLRTIEIGFPLGLPLCDSLGQGLWEVRSTLTNKTEVRLIFFHDSAAKALVVVHGFVKKSRKTPKSEINLALKRKKEFSP